MSNWVDKGKIRATLRGRKSQQPQNQGPQKTSNFSQEDRKKCAIEKAKERDQQLIIICDKLIELEEIIKKQNQVIKFLVSKIRGEPNG